MGAVTMSKTNPKSYRKPRSQMHKLQRALPLVLAGLLIVIAVWWLNPGGFRTPGSIGAGGAPQLEADQEIIDLGDIKLGVGTSAAFTLTNTGNQTLTFTEAPYVEI